MRATSYVNINMCFVEEENRVAICPGSNDTPCPYPYSPCESVLHEDGENNNNTHLSPATSPPAISDSHGATEEGQKRETRD